MREKMMTIKPIATQSMHKKKQMYKSERRSRGFLFELNPVGEIDEKKQFAGGLRKQIKDQISRIKTNKRKKIERWRRWWINKNGDDKRMREKRARKKNQINQIRIVSHLKNSFWVSIYICMC